MKKVISIICIIALISHVLLNNEAIALTYKNNDDTAIGRIEEKDLKEEDNRKLNVKDEYIEVLLGGAIELEYNFEGYDENEPELIWRSDDNEIAYYSNGMIFGNKEGRTRIEVSTFDGKIKDEVSIEVVRNYNNELIHVENRSSDYTINFSGTTRYEINNTSGEAFRVNTSGRYNIVSFNANGDLLYVRRNDYGYFNVRVGERIRIEAFEDSEVTLNIPQGYSNYIKSSTVPVLEYIEFEKDKVYELSNNYTDDITLKSEYYGSYNYVNYEKSGAIGTYWYNDTGYIYTYAGRKKKLELSGTSKITCYIPYDLRDKIVIKEINEPLFEYIEFEKDKVYELSNNYTDDITLKSEYYGSYNYVNYEKSGAIGTYWYNDTGYIYTYAGRKKKLELSGTSKITCYIPYDLRDKIVIKEINEPLFEYIEFEKDKVYEISNNYTDNITLKSGYYGSYNYVNYDKNDEIGNYRCNDVGYIYTYVGEKKKIELNGISKITCYMPYDVRDKIIIKEINEPVLEYIEFEKDKVYEINNNYTEDITLESGGYGRYNYIRYDKNGEMQNSRYAYEGYIYAYKESTLRVENIGSNNKTCYIPYDYKKYIEVKETTMPVFYQLNMESGKAYTIRNKMNYKIYIPNTSSYSGNRYNLKRYDELGNLKDNYTERYGDITMNARDTISITQVKGDNMTLYIPYEVMSTFNIQAVNIGVNGRSYDVMKERLNILSDNEKEYDINIKVDWEGKTPKLVRLLQGDRYLDIYSNNAKYKLGAFFNTNEDIYAVAISEDGEYSPAEKLYLNIKNNNMNGSTLKTALDN